MPERYIQLPVNMSKLIGITTSVLLSYLIQIDILLADWVPLPIDTVYDETSLSKGQQETAFLKLKRLGIVQVKQGGMPKVRMIRFSEDYEQKIRELEDSAIEALEPGTLASTTVAGNATTEEKTESLKSGVDTTVAGNATTEFEEQEKEKEEKEKERKKESLSPHTPLSKERKIEKEKQEKEKETRNSKNFSGAIEKASEENSNSLPLWQSPKEPLPVYFGHETEPYKFAVWFKAELKSIVRAQSIKEADLQSWAQCYAKLIRKGYKKMEIVKVCLWARSDKFWSTNFYTPCKLLRKSENLGLTYMEKFLLTSKENSKVKEYSPV